MSFSKIGRRSRVLGLAAALWLALPVLGWAQTSPGAVCATFAVPSCAPACHSHHLCPPAYKYVYEGAPRIHWSRGCPHPICNPCDLVNWGYYETCWTPWPFAPNWSHCPSLPPAALVNLNPNVNPNMPLLLPRAPQVLPPTLPTTPTPMTDPLDELPPPQRIESNRPF